MAMDPMPFCREASPPINGGTYYCLLPAGHGGPHRGESGEVADAGVWDGGLWEIKFKRECLEASREQWRRQAVWLRERLEKAEAVCRMAERAKTAWNSADALRWNEALLAWREHRP